MQSAFKHLSSKPDGSLDNDLFVANIPIDMDKSGLQNLFSRAGVIDSVKIVPSKNPMHTYTYGFVRFKNKTDAATAIELFNDYKIGTNAKRLVVRLRNMPTERNGEPLSKDTSVLNRIHRSEKWVTNNDQEDDKWEQVKEPSVASSASASLSASSSIRGVQAITSRPVNMHTEIARSNDDQRAARKFNLSRPFARRLMSRKSSSSSVNSTDSPNKCRSLNEFIAKSSAKPTEKNLEPVQKLEIGQTYKVNITHVNSPSWFYIQLSSHVPATANLMNNMDNFYKNELTDEMDAVPTDRKQEFCETGRSSLRCKLADVEPVNSETGWSLDVMKIFKMLADSDDLYAKVMHQDRVQNDKSNSSAKEEEIEYSIDLLFDQDKESVVQYLIENHEVKKTGTESRSPLASVDSGSRLYEDLRENYLEQRTTTMANTVEEAIRTTQWDDININMDIPSVSMVNLVEPTDEERERRRQAADEAREAYRAHITPNARNKMFNGSFKIWKKRDFNPCHRKYKCGQIVDVRISHLADSMNFFVQDMVHIRDLEHIESCIENYVQVLLKDSECHDDLVSFQQNTNKFDVVLVKCSWDERWRRAIFLDKINSDSFATFMSDDDLVDEDDEPTTKRCEQKNYFSFFIYDWGREDLIIKTRRQLNEDLFIMPMNEKLVNLGAFALKCSINECTVKLRESYQRANQSAEINAELRNRFEDEFKRQLANKNLRIRISQMVNIKSDLQAVVELYYLPENVNSRRVVNCVENLLNLVNKNSYVDKLNQSVDNDVTLKEDTDKENIVEERTATPPMQVSTKKPFEEQNPNLQFVPRSVQAKTPQTVVTSESPAIKISTTTTTTTPPPIKHPKFEKLEKDQTYKVVLQSYDESMADKHFYLVKVENSDKLEQLADVMQREPRVDGQFSYVNDLKQIKACDQLEALYDLDNRWYRVWVTRVSQVNLEVEVFFVDYGNTQLLEAQSIKKLLRRRNTFADEREQSLLGMNYQAIKCFYSHHEQRLDEFIKQLLETEENYESGFSIRVNETIEKTWLDTVYGVDLTPTWSESELHDAEVRTILAKKPPVRKHTQYSIYSMDLTNRQVEINEREDCMITNVDSVFRFHLNFESSNKFFCDNEKTLKPLFDYLKDQQGQDDLLNEYEFNVGDYVFAQFVLDLSWYRGVVLDKLESTYQVYFVDYGNRHEASKLCSVELLKQIRTKIGGQVSTPDELDQIVQQPFHAVCCQLDENRFFDNENNIQTLKTLSENLVNVKLIALTRETLLESVELNKYKVDILVEQLSLDDKLEKVKPPVNLNRCLLEPNRDYVCKFAMLDELTNDLYVNLAEQSDAQIKVDTELNELAPTIDQIPLKRVGDLVLAKFYTDEQNFNWYRAVITELDDAKKRYKVFFVDYGNYSLDYLIDADVTALPDAYSLEHHAPFAYKLELSLIDAAMFKSYVDKHMAELSEFISELFVVKVISYTPPVNDSQLITYSTELWDINKSLCLNKLIDKNYMYHQVAQEKKPPVRLIDRPNLSLNSGGVYKAKLVFGEDFLKPLYFSLEPDLARQHELQEELNTFYTASKLSSVELKATEYVAVYSDNAWYRAQVKSVDPSTDTANLLYIDHGWEEQHLICSDKCRKLDDRFLKEARLALGASLADCDTIGCDESQLQNALAEFFASTYENDIIDLHIIGHLTPPASSINFHSDEQYFTVAISNATGDSLNKIIKNLVEKQKQASSIISAAKLQPTLPTKKPRPPMIRLGIDKMPSVKDTLKNPQDECLLFVRSIDLFYVFSAKNVMLIQQRVQTVCSEMLKQREATFLPDQDVSDRPDIGNLIYCKYAEDQMWYRGLVTNVNVAKKKYEVFFIDFGNTEIINYDDLIPAWTNEQMSIFGEFAPQAIKARLFNARPTSSDASFTEQANLSFKKRVLNQSFEVRLIKYDQENDIYDVSLDQAHSTNVHLFLISENIIKMKDFAGILNEIQTAEELALYQNLLTLLGPRETLKLK